MIADREVIEAPAVMYGLLTALDVDELTARLARLSRLRPAA